MVLNCSNKIDCSVGVLGGIEDAGEPKSAAIRELREETRIVSTEIIAKFAKMSGAGFRASIPSSVRRTIQNIKEITDNHNEENVYAMLKECSMDPNETTQKLLLQVNGIDFEEIKVDLSKRQQLSPEFREDNPLRKVPAIVDGRFKLFESHLIPIYKS
ncbi:Glutathione S-transferase T1 [Glycine soja]|uniref:Glutathione S-transferase T1 n=1 Tax=Glycine soja TaxID=3848 RepID=A0A445LPY2_GLYSO|nr:Glutathione S-transferase T1 [Glycine soja]